jgi:hypothetical protein
LQHVWGHFLHLHNGRSFGRWGPDPIRYTDIAAYTQLRDVTITPFEVELITRLDGLFRCDKLHPIEFEPEGGIKSVMQALKARQKKD